MQQLTYFITCILALHSAAAAGIDGVNVAATAWQSMPPTNWIILQSNAAADEIASGDAGEAGNVGAGVDNGNVASGNRVDDVADISFPYIKREPIRTYNRLALQLAQSTTLSQQPHQHATRAIRKQKPRRPDVLSSYNTYNTLSYHNYTHTAHSDINDMNSNSNITNNNNNNNHSNNKRKQELRLVEHQPYVLAIRTNAERDDTIPARNVADTDGDGADDDGDGNRKHIKEVMLPKDMKRRSDNGRSRSRSSIDAGVDVVHKFQRQQQLPLQQQSNDDNDAADDDDSDDDDDVGGDEQRLNEILVPLQGALERVKNFCDILQEYISTGTGNSSNKHQSTNSDYDADHGDDDDDDFDDGDKSVSTHTSVNEPRSHAAPSTAATSSSTATTVGTGRGKKLKKKLKKLLLPLLIAYKLKFLTLIPVLIGGLTLLVGTTGLAGFFFALFTAVMSLKSSGGGSKSIVLKHN